jgi:hypothetical protein
MTNHGVQCFHGVQEKHYDVEESKSYDTGRIKFNKITSHHNVEKEKIQGETPIN